MRNTPEDMWWIGVEQDMCEISVKIEAHKCARLILWIKAGIYIGSE